MTALMVKLTRIITTVILVKLPTLVKQKPLPKRIAPPKQIQQKRTAQHSISIIRFTPISPAGCLLYAIFQAMQVKTVNLLKQFVSILTVILSLFKLTICQTETLTSLPFLQASIQSVTELEQSAQRIISLGWRTRKIRAVQPILLPVRAISRLIEFRLPLCNNFFAEESAEYYQYFLQQTLS